MKPYGLPRILDLIQPDCADINLYALKSSSSHIKGKGGDIRNSVRNSAVKRATRRIYKKRIRAKHKHQLRLQGTAVE